MVTAQRAQVEIRIPLPDTSMMGTPGIDPVVTALSDLALDLPVAATASAP